MQNSEFKIATYRELRAFTHYIELQGEQKKRGCPIWSNLLVCICGDYCFTHERSSLNEGFLPCIKIPTR